MKVILSFLLVLISISGFCSLNSCTSATSLVITADSMNMTNPKIILKDSTSLSSKY